MINKRLLVKALLAHNDENSFFDKKLKLNLGERRKGQIPQACMCTFELQSD